MTTDGDQVFGVRRIVVGVDASESASHAALWAAREAQCRGVPLTLTHAVHLPSAAVAPVEPDDFAERQQTAGLEIVEASAARIRQRYPGLTLESDICTQSAAQRLCDVSANDVMVVTGTRGHGGLTGLLLGSVSHALAVHASGPLVVVRGAEPEEANGPVVLGVGPNPAESAIEFAFAAARRYGTSLRVVRAWMLPLPSVGTGMPGSAAFGLGEPAALFAPEAQDSDADEAGDAARAVEPVRKRYPQVRFEVSAVAGNAVPALADVGARLVVVGSHRHRGLFSVGAGHVVDGLICHSPAPVAVIPELAPLDGSS
jgi:nucleotide-binding universal stress UspA family protein